MKKSLATLTAIIFALTNIAFAHRPTENVWESRKKSFEIAALPTLPNSVSNISAIKKQPFLRTSTKNHPHSMTSYPDEFFGHMNVREVHTTGRQKPLVLIEDVHQHLEAQTHISQALLLLGREKGSAAVTVALEGAHGGFIYPKFHAYPNQAVLRDVADSFLETGDISGPAHAGYLSRREPGTSGLSFVGVDDPAAYQANVAAYKNTKSIKAGTLAAIASLKASNDQAKKNLFNPSLARFDNQVEVYRSGKTGIAEYAEAVAPFSTALSIEQFLSAQKMERSMDFTRVELERKVVLEKLLKSAGEKGLQDLVEISLAYQQGTASFGDYYSFLRAKCQKHGVDLSQTPHFDNYVRYVLLSDGIRADKLFDDLNNAEATAYDTLARTGEEKRAVAMGRQLHLAQTLVEFSLTSNEWSQYLGGRELLAGKLDLTGFERFYAAAELRNEKMVANLPRASSMVMVAGGFHTAGLTKIFRKKNIPYIVVTPKLTKVDIGSANAYLSVFDREKTPLEQIFSGKKLFVPAPVAGGNDRMLPPGGPQDPSGQIQLFSDAIQGKTSAGMSAEVKPKGEPAPRTITAKLVAARNIGANTVYIFVGWYAWLRAKISEYRKPLAVAADLAIIAWWIIYFLSPTGDNIQMAAMAPIITILTWKIHDKSFHRSKVRPVDMDEATVAAVLGDKQIAGEKIHSNVFPGFGHALINNEGRVEISDSKGTRPLPIGMFAYAISLAFSPGGTVLAIGLSNGNIVLWNAMQDEILNNVNNSVPAERIGFTQNGYLIAANGADITYWEMPTIRKKPGLNGKPHARKGSTDVALLVVLGLLAALTIYLLAPVLASAALSTNKPLGLPLLGGLAIVVFSLFIFGLGVNPQRIPFIGANWKMNMKKAEAVEFIERLNQLGIPEGQETVIFPAFPYLDAVGQAFQGKSLQLGAQNIHQSNSGAYTGEVSANMLIDLGVRYVLIGHSERRHLQHETDANVNQKLKTALAKGLIPILCVGETLPQLDDSGLPLEVENQLQMALRGISTEDAQKIVIAYEPVWAIGTGETATPAMIQSMHSDIRMILSQLKRQKEEKPIDPSRIRIIYGGTVKEGNIDEIMAQPDVDGVLVGGASLEVARFKKILDFRTVDKIRTLINDGSVNAGFQGKTGEMLKKWLDPVYEEDHEWILGLLTKIKSGTTDEKIDAVEEINDSFFKELAPGTAGIRGKLGRGPNRVNKFTVGKFTLAKALIMSTDEFVANVKRYDPEFDRKDGRGAVLAKDPREGGDEIMMRAALLYLTIGKIDRVYIYPEPRTTPQLSWSVQSLNAAIPGVFFPIVTGDMVTASHNPKTDNGIKPYDPDGSQVTGELAQALIDTYKSLPASDLAGINYRGINLFGSLDELKKAYELALEKKDIELIGTKAHPAADKEFLKSQLEETLDADDAGRFSEDTLNALNEDDLGTIFYISPLNGSARQALEPLLHQRGIDPSNIVWFQDQPRGDFGDVKTGSPNPENPKTREEMMQKVLDDFKAGKIRRGQTIILLWADPDADRPALVVLHVNDDVTPTLQDFHVFNGNQQLALMADYFVSKIAETKRLFAASTVVSGFLMKEIFRRTGIQVVETLTGFKYIGDEIEKAVRNGLAKTGVSKRAYLKMPLWERMKLMLMYSTWHLFGGEESLGSTTGDSTHDKNAISGISWLIEMVAYNAQNGVSVEGRLKQIYEQVGYMSEPYPMLDFSQVYKNANGDAVKVSEAEADGIIGKGDNPELSILGQLRANVKTGGIEAIAGKRIAAVLDYQEQTARDLNGNILFDGTPLPKENFITLLLEDGSMVIARPSGTEPKIKFYIIGRGDFADKAAIDQWGNEDAKKFLEDFVNGIAQQRFPEKFGGSNKTNKKREGFVTVETLLGLVAAVSLLAFFLAIYYGNISLNIPSLPWKGIFATIAFAFLILASMPQMVPTRSQQRAALIKDLEITLGDTSVELSTLAIQGLLKLGPAGKEVLISRHKKKLLKYYAKRSMWNKISDLGTREAADIILENLKGGPNDQTERTIKRLVGMGRVGFESMLTVINDPRFHETVQKRVLQTLNDMVGKHVTKEKKSNESGPWGTRLFLHELKILLSTSKSKVAFDAVGILKGLTLDNAVDKKDRIDILWNFYMKERMWNELVKLNPEQAANALLGTFSMHVPITTEVKAIMNMVYEMGSVGQAQILRLINRTGVNETIRKYAIALSVKALGPKPKNKRKGTTPVELLLALILISGIIATAVYALPLYRDLLTPRNVVITAMVLIAAWFAGGLKMAPDNPDEPAHDKRYYISKWLQDREIISYFEESVFEELNKWLEPSRSDEDLDWLLGLLQKVGGEDTEEKANAIALINRFFAPEEIPAPKPTPEEYRNLLFFAMGFSRDFASRNPTASQTALAKIALSFGYDMKSEARRVNGKQFFLIDAATAEKTALTTLIQPSKTLDKFTVDFYTTDYKRVAQMNFFFELGEPTIENPFPLYMTIAAGEHYRSAFKGAAVNLLKELAIFNFSSSGLIIDNTVTPINEGEWSKQGRLIPRPRLATGTRSVRIQRRNPRQPPPLPSIPSIPEEPSYETTSVSKMADEVPFLHPGMAQFLLSGKLPANISPIHTIAVALGQAGRYTFVHRGGHHYVGIRVSPQNEWKGLKIAVLEKNGKPLGQASISLREKTIEVFINSATANKEMQLGLLGALTRLFLQRGLVDASQMITFGGETTIASELSTFGEFRDDNDGNSFNPSKRKKGATLVDLLLVIGILTSAVVYKVTGDLWWIFGGAGGLLALLFVYHWILDKDQPKAEPVPTEKPKADSENSLVDTLAQIAPKGPIFEAAQGQTTVTEMNIGEIADPTQIDEDIRRAEKQVEQAANDNSKSGTTHNVVIVLHNVTSITAEQKTRIENLQGAFPRTLAVVTANDELKVDGLYSQNLILERAAENGLQAVKDLLAGQYNEAEFVTYSRIPKEFTASPELKKIWKAWLGSADGWKLLPIETVLKAAELAELGA